MRLISNKGSDRVIDSLNAIESKNCSISIVSSDFSIFAFEEVQRLVKKAKQCRFILAPGSLENISVLGEEPDRHYRNRFENKTLAESSLAWLEKIEFKVSFMPTLQSLIVFEDADGSIPLSISGSCPFTTCGFGLAPSKNASLIQCTEDHEEGALFYKWFEDLWNQPDSTNLKTEFIQKLIEISTDKCPNDIYLQTLHHIFSEYSEHMNEDEIIKSSTGVKETKVWKKLYKFQYDGAIGAIEKLEQYGGCIIADSVGLGKTFEALAVIKYYELRNDRVLVLCPKRLRDNWTLYRSNDRRNILAKDRLHYDVLNHTDLSREQGYSGDIDLSYINWGNYDLVVIDESHNFRNKSTHKDRLTRYGRMMEDVIRAGVKTKVLMLSATPVNNRLADLKNQIAFITEGEDDALAHAGINSIELTTRRAQIQFNRWLDLPEDKRSSESLLDRLGYDYFKLLDLLTIARSRRHIEKYYGIAETGKFPDRLKPKNIKTDVDLENTYNSIKETNDSIRKLTLGSYAPLRYILPGRQKAYDEKYSIMVRDGKSVFKQADREESLIHLMRVNVLKRMESSVHSFRLTLSRLLNDVDGLITRIEAHDDSITEVNIEDIEVDDPAFESLLVGNKVKVLLKDVDLIKWKQDLGEDSKHLQELLSASKVITPVRDAKLDALKKELSHKIKNPHNPGNKKVLIFTAFADTANYLYDHLNEWLFQKYGVHSALVTGSGTNKTNAPHIRTDLGTILSTFSPLSKERSEEFNVEGEIDILIGTDCISEGQNLQDCDTLINYDIHWNPVRIIQRFGRIDRIGSKNNAIQLINFWPNMELEEYINLEQRVSGRMVLLDISATGEENIIDTKTNKNMNDLEYRRKQLEKLQNTVIDLEDLSSGISITDLTLGDFRYDLIEVKKVMKDMDWGSLPIGSFSVVTSDEDVAPGVIFCLKAASESAIKAADPDDPLAPYYLVHIGDDGEVLLTFTQAKKVLDKLKKSSHGKNEIETDAYQRFKAITKHGMSYLTEKMASATTAISGKSQERAVASLFSPGGTHAGNGEFKGANDFEVITYLVVLPEKSE